MATYRAPATFICDDCGELIEKGSPALFNAAQEIVHEDCGEELHVNIAVARKHLETVPGVILDSLIELAQEAVKKMASRQISPLREVKHEGGRPEVFKGSDAVLIEFVCRAVR